MLTKQERLKKALRLETVDRPPCICPGGMMNMVGKDMMAAAGIFWPAAHLDPGLMAGLAAAAYETECFENCGVPFCMTVEAEAMGSAVDLGTADHEPRITGYALRSVKEWETLPPPDFSTGRPRVVLEAIQLLRKQTDIPVIGNLTGPISTATSLIEPTVFYKELRKYKEHAHALMDFIGNGLLAFGLKQLEAGADVIALSDPGGTGEILGPALFGDYVVPSINQITRGLKASFPEAGIIVHICGRMHSVFEPLAAIECDALSFDALVPLQETRKRLPGKAIMGNISTYALEFADGEKISRMAALCAQHADIVAPACGMGTRTPLPNIRAILQGICKQGVQ